MWLGWKKQVIVTVFTGACQHGGGETVGGSGVGKIIGHWQNNGDGTTTRSENIGKDSGKLWHLWFSKSKIRQKDDQKSFSKIHFLSNT